MPRSNSSQSNNFPSEEKDQSWSSFIKNWVNPEYFRYFLHYVGFKKGNRSRLLYLFGMISASIANIYTIQQIDKYFSNITDSLKTGNDNLPNLSDSHFTQTLSYIPISETISYLFPKNVGTLIIHYGLIQIVYSATNRISSWCANRLGRSLGRIIWEDTTEKLHKDISLHKNIEKFDLDGITKHATGVSITIHKFFDVVTQLGSTIWFFFAEIPFVVGLGVITSISYLHSRYFAYKQTELRDEIFNANSKLNEKFDDLVINQELFLRNGRSVSSKVKELKEAGFKALAAENELSSLRSSAIAWIQDYKSFHLIMIWGLMSYLKESKPIFALTHLLRSVPHWNAFGTFAMNFTDRYNAEMGYKRIKKTMDEVVLADVKVKIKEGEIESLENKLKFIIRDSNERISFELSSKDKITHLYLPSESITSINTIVNTSLDIKFKRIEFLYIKNSYQEDQNKVFPTFLHKTNLFDIITLSPNLSLKWEENEQNKEILRGKILKVLLKFPTLHEKYHEFIENDEEELDFNKRVKVIDHQKKLLIIGLMAQIDIENSPELIILSHLISSEKYSEQKWEAFIQIVKDELGIKSKVYTVSCPKNSEEKDVPPTPRNATKSQSGASSRAPSPSSTKSSYQASPSTKGAFASMITSAVGLARHISGGDSKRSSGEFKDLSEVDTAIEWVGVLSRSKSEVSMHESPVRRELQRRGPIKGPINTSVSSNGRD